VGRFRTGRPNPTSVSIESDLGFANPTSVSIESDLGFANPTSVSIESDLGFDRIQPRFRESMGEVQDSFG
jgi:hypothetical protein